MPLAGDSTILVPVDVSGSKTPAEGILDLLGLVDVVLLGYYPVPDQAAPAQLKHEHESEAARRLEEIADGLAEGDGNVTEVLVFTHDRQETIDRIADEHDCDAVLTAGEADSVERVLVPLRGEANLERILSLVGDLLQFSDASVTLFHSGSDDADRRRGKSLLDDATDHLIENGIDRGRIDRRLSEDGEAWVEIVEFGTEFDVLVLGETEPSLRERILGDVPTKIVDKTDKPAFVVRDTQ